jgi:hypothetical protein
MPTSYSGREDHHDLGAGHSFVWILDRSGKAIGLMEHHPKGPDSTPGALYCGGYVCWTPADEQDVAAPWKASNHQLLAGCPGDEQHLTLAPSLACRNCPSHGFIRDGRWVDA